MWQQRVRPQKDRIMTPSEFHRSKRRRTNSSGRSGPSATSSAKSPIAPPQRVPAPKVLAAQREIVNLLQRLVLERPNMVLLARELFVGMLGPRRRDDR